MRRRYVTADVFTSEMFKGNPLAVVLDAEGLTTVEMQAIAVEFNYSETTFVLPASDPAHTAHVRIFTTTRELPFAGHPNVGTAFVLAREAATSGRPVPDRMVFEEAAGLVPITLLREGGTVTGAEFAAPEPLFRGAALPAASAAALLSLDAADIRTEIHAPQVASVGLPFLVVELTSRAALRRAHPNLAAYAEMLPLDGAHAVYTYTKALDPAETDAGFDLQARMFMSRMAEDPATGSATAAATALLAEISGGAGLRLRIGQGTDMGRASLLLARVAQTDGRSTTFVGGHCAAVMEGALLLP